MPLSATADLQIVLQNYKMISVKIRLSPFGWRLVMTWGLCKKLCACVCAWKILRLFVPLRGWRSAIIGDDEVLNDGEESFDQVLALPLVFKIAGLSSVDGVHQN